AHNLVSPGAGVGVEAASRRHVVLGVGETLGGRRYVQGRDKPAPLRGWASTRLASDGPGLPSEGSKAGPEALVPVVRLGHDRVERPDRCALGGRSVPEQFPQPYPRLVKLRFGVPDRAPPQPGDLVVFI